MKQHTNSKIEINQVKLKDKKTNLFYLFQWGSGNDNSSAIYYILCNIIRDQGVVNVDTNELFIGELNFNKNQFFSLYLKKYSKESFKVTISSNTLINDVFSIIPSVNNF